MKMGLGTYLIVLFGISVVFYLMGYAPAGVQMISAFASSTGVDLATGQTTADFGATVLNTLLGIFTNPVFLISVGLASVASFLGGGNNFSVMYLIPIIILVAFANLFLMPSAVFYDVTLPVEMRLILAVFFNLWLVLAIIGFVRGGEL